jgi:hypothetical protein
MVNKILSGLAMTEAASAEIKLTLLTGTDMVLD